MNTATIEAAITKAYPWPQFSVVWQVRDAAGFDAIRTGDAIVMGLWPSRGLTLRGLEIKTDRRDWLRELQNPAKAEAIAAYCDEFYIVAPDGMVKIEEVPIAWGLMEVDEKGKLHTTREGSTPFRMEAKPITRTFLASLLKSACKQASAPTREVLAAEFGRGVKHGLEDERTPGRRSEHALASLRESVAVFEKASGIHLDTYSGGQIGEAVALLRSMRWKRGNLREHIQRVTESAAAMAEAVAQIEEQFQLKEGRDGTDPSDA